MQNAENSGEMIVSKCQYYKEGGLAERHRGTGPGVRLDSAERGGSHGRSGSGEMVTPYTDTARHEPSIW